MKNSVRTLLPIAMTILSTLCWSSSMVLAQQGHTRSEVECENNEPHVDDRIPHLMTPNDFTSPCEGEVILSSMVIIPPASCFGEAGTDNGNAAYSLHCRNETPLNAHCRMHFNCSSGGILMTNDATGESSEVSSFSCSSAAGGHHQIGVHPDTGKGYFKCGGMSGELKCIS